VKRQVDDLILVQERDGLLDDLEGASGRQQEEALGFRMEETTRIRRERERLVSGISPDLLRRHERLRQRHPRAVVGTRGRVCLGCNTLRPTAMASRAVGLETCERCGRILYHVEPPELPPRGTDGTVAAGRPKAEAAPRKASTRRRSSRSTGVL
jgi:hypothetical protein